MASNIITSGTLPPNHRKFASRWTIATFRRPNKKDTTSKKEKEVGKDNKEVEMFSNIFSGITAYIVSGLIGATISATITFVVMHMSLPKN